MRRRGATSRSKSLRYTSVGMSQVPDNVLRNNRKQAKPPNELDRKLDATTIRAAVLNRVCPWCDAGPFASIAGHVSRVHGIYTRELRDLAGLTYSIPLTSPELHEIHSKRATEFIRKGHTRPIRDNGPYIFALSPAAAAGAAARLRTVSSSEQRKQAHEASRTAFDRKYRPLYEEVARAYEEAVKKLGAPYGAKKLVAERLGLSAHDVDNRLIRARRLGLTTILDGNRRTWSDKHG